MKASISSGVRLFAAMFVAFVLSAGITACETTKDADAESVTTEQAASSNVAAENGASENAANAANDATEADNAANAANNKATAGTEEGAAEPTTSSTEAVADPFATPAPVAPSNAASTPPANGTGTELQNLVSESASGSAAGVATPAPAAEGGDPFAPVAPSPAENKAVAAPAEVPTNQPNASVPSVAESDNAMPANLPEPGARMPYYIQRGDTLAEIAALVYGDKSQWKKLAEENNLKNSSLIYAGDVLFYSLNEKSKAFAKSYESVVKQTVTVAPGDTLSSIAEKVMGSSHEWRSLWKMNSHVTNPDHIAVGMVLTYRKGTDMKAAALDTVEELPSEEAEVQAEAATPAQAGNAETVFVGMSQ